jgi:cytochrome c biogenesis factor
MMFHLIFELYDKEYSMALMFVLVAVLVVLCIQILCLSGLGLIAWILVFMPLIVYTYMGFLLFVIFGSDPTPALKKYEVKM